MGSTVWLDAAFDCATAERDHSAIRPQTDEKMTSEIHPHWDADPCIIVCKNIEGLRQDPPPPPFEAILGHVLFFLCFSSPARVAFR